MKVKSFSATTIIAFDFFPYKKVGWPNSRPISARTYIEVETLYGKVRGAIWRYCDIACQPAEASQAAGHVENITNVFQPN